MTPAEWQDVRDFAGFLVVILAVFAYMAFGGPR